LLSGRTRGLGTISRGEADQPDRVQRM